MRRSGMSGEYTQNEARTVMRERREERKGTCMHGAIEVRAINRSKHNDIRHTHIQAPPCCPLTLLLPVSLATNTRIQPQHPATGECQKRQRLIGLDSAHKRDGENPIGFTVVLFREVTSEELIERSTPAHLRLTAACKRREEKKRREEEKRRE